MYRSTAVVQQVQQYSRKALTEAWAMVHQWYISGTAGTSGTADGTAGFWYSTVQLVQQRYSRLEENKTTSKGCDHGVVELHMKYLVKYHNNEYKIIGF
jgi:hypothetical protein